MANFQLSSRKKRGPQPSSLSVRLFLLDPDKTITKVTRETCSKGGIEQLMQKGCGPPQREHCVSDDKVEFSLGLTNEQFKQKLVEIYPKLENACFVFMKADKNNKLEKLNHGMCCFRCYTPENVYHSARGQRRLYIQKIAESEITQCTHQVSLVKRLCVLPGHSQQRFVPIQPKLLPAVCTITGVESRPLLVMTPGPGAIPLDLSSTPTPTVLSSGNIVPQRQSSAIVPQTETTPSVCSTVNISTQSVLSSTVISQNTSSQPVNVILQNQLPTSTITSQAESNQSFNSSINMVPQDRLQTPPTIVTQTTLSQPVQSSGNMVTQNQLSAPTDIVPQATSRPAAQSYVNMIPQNLLPSLTIASQTESNPLLSSSVNMVTRNQLQPPSDIFSQTVSRSAAQIPVNMVLPNVLPTSTSFVPRNTSTSLFDNSVNMVTQNQLPAPVTAVSWTAPRPAAQNFVNMLPQSWVPSTVSTTAYTPPVLSAATQLPISTSFASGNAAMSPFQDPLNMMTQNQLHASASLNMMTQNQLHASAGSMARQGQFSRSIGVPGTNFEQLAFHTPVSRREPPMAGTDGNVDTSMLLASVTGFQMTNVVSGLHDPSTASNSRITSLSNPPDFPASSYRWMQSPGLVTLVDAIDTVQRGDWIPTDANISNDQGNLDLQGPVESLMDIDSFLENVKSTGKLEISSSILDNDDLMEKLNTSTINIHTVEIESTCKLHQALRVFSLPSCLTVLCINDNMLNLEDICALIRSLSTVIMNNLHELSLSHTRFKDNAFISFLNVLISCSSLRKLCLIDNGLNKQEINFLITAFDSLKNLVNLNLSKSNVTETQVIDILQKQEGKSIVSLDLSQNVLQGNEIFFRICHLQSLEELNLSCNHIRFFSLPNLEKRRVHLPISTTTILLSSNHMMPLDICRFCHLVRSDLLKLNLDFNHVGGSVWSLCSLSIRHLKVLSLANTDIGGPAVKGLAILLSLVGELEELNLYSNNLVLADFQQLQSPLSNLKCI